MLLLKPMAFYVFYMFLLGICNFIVRKRAIASGSVKPGYFKNLDISSFAPPEFVVRVGRHYDNQFEMPLLFFITCIVATQVHVFHPLIGTFAWAFIVSRLLHSYFHLGSNKIIPRAGFFMVGWLMIIAMWVMILLQSSMERVM